MKPDLEKAISMVISTGKVKLGYNAVLKSISSGKVKTAIISNNLPLKLKRILIRNCNLSQVPIIQYEKNGFDLGAVCGRPHLVSALVILDPGNSKILDYLQ